MGTIRQVIFHTPGPQWQSGVDFREQRGVMAHVEHYAKLQSDGLLELGGPFPQSDRGGMMVCAPDVCAEDAESYAAADPAVAAGLLRYEVVAWYVAMERDTT